MKTIIATSPVKVKSESAAFSAFSTFDHTLTAFAGEAAEMLEDIAKAFNTKLKLPTLYGGPTVNFRLTNSNVTVEDAIAVLDKHTSNYGWTFDNVSTAKSFEVLVQFNKIGFVVTGKMIDGFIQQKTMILHLG